MLRVTFHAIRLAFEKGRAAPFACAVDGAPRGFMNREHIVAVDGLAGDPVCRGAVGEALRRRLLSEGGRVGPAVVLGHHDERQLLNRREVEPLVKRAGRGSPVADVRHGDDPFLLQPSAQGDSGHDGNESPEHGDRRHDARFRRSEMEVAVFAARRGARAGHVLRQNVARRKPHDEDRPEVADERPEHVALRERVRRTDGSRFLSEGSIQPADDLALAVEIDEFFLEDAVQPEIPVELDLLLARQLVHDERRIIAAGRKPAAEETQESARLRVPSSRRPAKRRRGR